MPRKKGITTAIYHNKYKPQKDGTCPVSIRVTFDGEKKHYDTGKRMTLEEYGKLYSQKPRQDQKIILSSFKNLEEKAQRIINSLGDAFTFSTFEPQYLTNTAKGETLAGAFDDYIESIEPDRIGTIESYQCASNSFAAFNGKAKIRDVNVRFLKDYEASMIAAGKSVTTIGIYCRSLRSVMNSLIADGKLNKDLYPFGTSKNRKFEIPSSKNTKKALTLQEIGKIFHHECEPGSIAEMCRDYWIFLYLANGINVKDFCLLKRGDIDGNRLSFIREKTVRTKKQKEAIEVVIQPEMMAIMHKWGARNTGKISFLFPHIDYSMDAKTVRDKVKLLTHLINENVKKIARSAGIEKDVTTYYARHSFATIMKNSGAPVAMISQALGHSSMATTQSYLASFEGDQLQEATNVLTSFLIEK